MCVCGRLVGSASHLFVLRDGFCLYVVGVMAMVNGYILEMTTARLLFGRSRGWSVFLRLLDGLILVVCFACLVAFVAVYNVVLALCVIFQC